MCNAAAAHQRTHKICLLFSLRLRPVHWYDNTFLFALPPATVPVGSPRQAGVGFGSARLAFCHCDRLRSCFERHCTLVLSPVSALHCATTRGLRRERLLAGVFAAAVQPVIASPALHAAQLVPLRRHIVVNARRGACGHTPVHRLT